MLKFDIRPSLNLVAEATFFLGGGWNILGLSRIHDVISSYKSLWTTTTTAAKQPQGINDPLLNFTLDLEDFSFFFYSRYFSTKRSKQLKSAILKRFPHHPPHHAVCLWTHFLANFSTMPYLWNVHMNNCTGNVTEILLTSSRWLQFNSLIRGI